MNHNNVFVMLNESRYASVIHSPPYFDFYTPRLQPNFVGDEQATTVAVIVISLFARATSNNGQGLNDAITTTPFNQAI